MAQKKSIQIKDESDAVEQRVDTYMTSDSPVMKSSESIPEGAPVLPDGDAEEQITSVDTSKQDKVEDTATTPAPVAAPSQNSLLEEADPLVDDIISDESDALLAAEDKEIARAFSNDKPTFRERITGPVSSWWHNRPLRYGTFLVLFLSVVAVGLIPTSRYFVLNNAGVRSTASLTVMDRTTQLPLRNVIIQIGDKTAKTDKEGWVQLKEVKLGTQELSIERIGFSEIKRSITIGFGSNPLGEEQLRAVGAQYTFMLQDFLSGKPVSGAEASSGEATARSDKNGEIILTVGQVEEEKMEVSVSVKGYRTEKVTIDTATKQPTPLSMVTNRKNVYVSKQSGKYDVFKIDVDGKHKKLLLAGSGLETDRISLVQHAEEERAALVSSREDKRNNEGYLLQTLTLLDVDNGDTRIIEQSEGIQIVSWIKDRLVYVKVKAGTSAGNPERFQLMSYDYKTSSRIQLATANYFSDVVSARGMVYYASTNQYVVGQAQFVRIGPDNTGKQVLLNSDVWTIQRAGYDGFVLNGSTGWYSYGIGDASAKKLENPPQNQQKFYLDSASNKSALWTENRDGKGVLLAYDAETKKDVTLTTQSGLTYPLKWLNDKTIAYRVVTPAETADYVLSLNGGEPRKIVDVTNAAGYGRWFYY